VAKIFRTRPGNSVGPPTPGYVHVDARKATLLQSYDVNVKVGTFTFRFRSIEQVRETLAFFQQKTRPSSRIAAVELERELGEDWRTQRGWEIERWFECLPMNLLREKTRQKVMKALTETLQRMENGELQTLEVAKPRRKKK
jgi:hypothetical protein